jgi:hypothetical protein
VLHEQRVERDPVRLGHDALERRFGLLGRRRPDHAEPVRDPMHMGVDRDRRSAVPEDEHAVRGLRAHPGQRRELFVGRRDLSAEPVEDLRGARPDRPRLRPVEPDLSDQRLEIRGVRPGEGRGVGEPGEQPGARDVRLLVPRPLGEDRSDQHLERILGVVAQVRASPIAGVVERRQPVEHGDPIEARRVAHVDPFPAGGAVSTPGSERSGSSFPPCAVRSSSPIK